MCKNACKRIVVFCQSLHSHLSPRTLISYKRANAANFGGYLRTTGVRILHETLSLLQSFS